MRSQRSEDLQKPLPAARHAMQALVDDGVSAGDDRLLPPKAAVPWSLCTLLKEVPAAIGEVGCVS